jgi:hypothetical protein
MQLGSDLSGIPEPSMKSATDALIEVREDAVNVNVIAVAGPRLPQSPRQPTVVFRPLS